MKKTLPIILLLTLLLGGCASLGGGSSPRDTLSYTSQVRHMSDADDVLFNDLVNAIAGVGFLDRIYYKDAKKRALVKIEIVSPYGSGSVGEERWTVQHDGGDTATYTVTMAPDLRGGTNFSVKADRPVPKP